MKSPIILALILSFFAFETMGMSINTKVLRSRAFSKQLPNGIFASLDLKQKKIKFTSADLQRCKSSIKRIKQTLKYTCTLWVPSKASTSILNNVSSPKKIAIHHGNLIKMVDIAVSKDGKTISFSTEFDNSAIDFDFAEFNKEVFVVFDEAASQIIGKAMTKNQLLMTTLEN